MILRHVLRGSLGGVGDLGVILSSSFDASVCSSKASGTLRNASGRIPSGATTIRRNVGSVSCLGQAFPLTMMLPYMRRFVKGGAWWILLGCGW